MKRDARGLEVTGAADAEIAAIDHFTEQLLGLGAETDAIMGAASASPDCPMIQAYAACTFVYTQSSAQAARALGLLQRARRRFRELTGRERIFVEAVEAGCRGDFERAITAYESIAQEWPRDVVAAKLAEFHFFQTGESARQLAFMRSVAPANRDHSHLLSMYAFALELCAKRDEAEEAARAAMRINPLTMWAQHCLAHVFAGQSRIAQGIAELQSYAEGWRGFGRYIQSHNWFHLATLYLAQLDFDRAREAFNSRVWGFLPDTAGELTDAVLLLWYLELAGMELDAEWRGIAPHARPYAHDRVFPFINAVAIYALARAGEQAEVDRAAAELERFAGRQSGRAARVWRDVGLPLVRGSAAFARRDYPLAAALLGPILNDAACAGGSDEQRGVFIQSNLVSLIRSQQKSQARRALDQYIGGRAVTPLERLWRDQI